MHKWLQLCASAAEEFERQQPRAFCRALDVPRAESNGQNHIIGNLWRYEKIARNSSNSLISEVMGKERGKVALNNVSHYLCWSSRLSELVASQIVSCQKLSDRVEMIEFFLDAALSCCRLGETKFSCEHSRKKDIFLTILSRHLSSLNPWRLMKRL